MGHISTREVYIDAARIAAERVRIIHPFPLVMRLDFADGVRLFSHGGRPNFNSGTTRGIAKDKDITVRVLEEETLPTPRSHFVCLKRSEFPLDVPPEQTAEYRKLLAFTQKVGFPVFFKPNAGSQGKNVFCVRNESELASVTQSLLTSSQGYFICQEACNGHEYRIVVIQGEIALAYTRMPLTVIGDGQSSIAELFAQKKADLIARGREISLEIDSEKIRMHLDTQGLSIHDIPETGRPISLLSNRNLSDGSEPVECTALIQERYAELCRAVYQRCGVDYCGLDLMEDTRSGEVRPVIIEINSSPGYKHFLRSSPENGPLVRDVFVKAIRAYHAREKIARGLPASVLTAPHIPATRQAAPERSELNS